MFYPGELRAQQGRPAAKLPHVSELLTWKPAPNRHDDPASPDGEFRGINHVL